MLCFVEGQSQQQAGVIIKEQILFLIFWSLVFCYVAWIVAGEQIIDVSKVNTKFLIKLFIHFSTYVKYFSFYSLFISTEEISCLCGCVYFFFFIDSLFLLMFK